MVKLHSRYNPHFEAERYLDALKISPYCECFILIEPGLGFLVPALKSRFKNCKIVALHAGLDFNTAETHFIPAWRPDSTTTVQDFLQKEIPNAEVSKVSMVEWRPSLNVYGDAYAKLVSQTVDFLKRSDAGRRTTAAMGKKWVKNFFKNLPLLKNALMYKTSDSPVVVACAGPALEAALPAIAEIREGALVIAASSSLLALEKGGIIPDIVISTDGSPWALHHLYPLFRAENNPPCSFPLPSNGKLQGKSATPSVALLPRIAASFFTALPSQCSKMPLLVLNEGSLWQNIVLKEMAVPSVLIPQMGTVAASAVELALALTRGNVYLAGLDLSIKGIRTHARPHGFDHLFFGRASRFSPVYGQCFSRALALRLGGSMEIYAAWFKNRLNHWPPRIFSLEGSHPMFEKAAPMRPAKAKSIDFKKVPVKKAPALGVQALIRSFSDAQLAQSLNDELAPMLFPGEENVPNCKLEEAVKELAACAFGGGGQRG
ncbi:MAG: DUF115 domain-containing protein [Spirochaetes bacterium]|nr:DUF115 domain-containing protein [Spirochaetota bacterium]